MFTGSTYLQVATQTSPSGGGEDSAHQQIPHIKALGSEYVAPGVVTRLASLGPESVPYRLLGVVDGTTLTYDPAPPPNAPTSLQAGQVAEFETTSIFVVRSQDDDHPFGLTHYMPGTPLGNSRDGCGPQKPFPGLTECDLGDEDWVNILAPKQFLQRYVFFTDPTYGTTNLVITRAKGANGFSEVSIDCLGGNVTGWQNVDGAGKYQVAYVDLVRGAQPIAQCTGSRHEAKSAGQFGVIVWGTDYFASYGYPAGGNAGSINNVSVPPVPK
ncbi:MAG: IgGFc-binding protein [Minicystis sp.]